ncbi:MAG: hypothetical protein ACREI8_07105, partial [Myxococcota bacterium]
MPSDQRSLRGSQGVRTVGAHRLCHTLQMQGRQRSEDHPSPGGCPRGGVTQDRSGLLCQSRGAIHAAPHEPILDPAGPSAPAHEQAGGGDADTRREAELRELLADLEDGTNGPQRIVLVGTQRDAEGENERGSLFVLDDLVQTSTEAVGGDLHGTNRALHADERVGALRVQARQADERHRRPAELREPVSLACVETRLHDTRHESQQRRFLGGRERA